MGPAGPRRSPPLASLPFNQLLSIPRLDLPKMRIPALDRTLAVLGYIPLLFWAPIFLRKDSLFAQFHGRQSFVLFLMYVLFVGLGLGVLLFTGTLLDVAIFSAMFLATGIYLLMSFIGLWKALTKERYRMPVVADVALMLGM